MESVEERQYDKPDKWTYFIDFYKYLFSEKKRELIIFALITFLLPVGPYIYLSLKLINDTDAHKLSFYGDGSMITLCAGIMCSYFVMLFEYSSDEERMNNTLLNLLLLMFYVILFLVFVECQLNFDRNWCFNFKIAILSTILILATFFVASYFNFKKNFSYYEVSKYNKDTEQKSIETKAQQVSKTDDNIEV